MALKIRSIPVLTGETAERFVCEADAVAARPGTKPLRMSLADVEKIEEASRRNIKENGGKSPFARTL